MIESISNYRVIRKLGTGGMGEVYLAHDPRLDRLVAVKLLLASEDQDRERRSRFLQEARAAASLQHPHIAHVYEIGESNGQHFIAMEYVDGETLDQKLKQTPLKLDQVVSLGDQIADALSEAHEKGITHRDIKPSNLIVTPRGRIKILDFGLAKVAPRAGNLSELPTAIKTTTGAVVGTVSYMSPEQALGREVDQRSDIFSLGIVLYESITGRRPFTGNTITEVIDRIVHGEPEALARFNYEIPNELERIVRKALEKDPERRYQTARELLTDLRNFARDQSLVASGSPRKVHSGSRRIIYSLITISVALAIAIAAYSLLFKAKPIDSVAVLPFANDGNDPNMEYLSDGISENLINRLSQLRGLRVVPRNTAFRYKGQQDAQEIGRALGVRAVVVGRIVQRGDTLTIHSELIDIQNQSQLWGERYQRKLTDIVAIEGEIAAGLADKLRLRLSEVERGQLSKRDTQNPEAFQRYLKGRYFWGKRNEPGIQKGIENFEQAINLDPSYAKAYAGLADCYNFLGAFGIALRPPGETMPKARAAARKALEIDESLADAHTSLAFVLLYYDWDWAAAEREFQRAIELDPNYAPAQQWYSHLLMARGETQASLTKAKLAAQIDPLSLAAHLNVGWQYHWARQYDSAVTNLQPLLEMDPNFEQGHWALGLALIGQGSFDRAADESQKAATLSQGNPVYLSTLGVAYGVGGKRAQALRIRTELEAQGRGKYVPPYWMATLNVALGDKDQAFRWLDEAYSERSGGLVWLGVDPRLDPIRQDPRFVALVKNVRIPHGQGGL